MIRALHRALRAFRATEEFGKNADSHALTAHCDDDALALQIAKSMRSLDDCQVIPAAIIVQTVELENLDRHREDGDTSRLQHPDSIDGYRVVDCLGVSETSAVYRVVHPGGEDDLVLKTIRPDRLSPSAVQAFGDELAKLRRLRHPCIVKPLQSVARARVGETDDVPYFVMPFIRGVSIRSYGQRAIKEDKIWAFAKICDAVGAAHDEGIVHGDLSATNILVDAAGVPHVLDFGIANHVKERNASTARLGTEACAPPEQRDPNAVSLPRWDVHNLGRIGALYLFSQELHFDADLAAIMRKAASPDPDRRYQSINELKADLHRYRTGHPVRAMEHRSWMYPLMKWISRKRVFAIAIAFLIVGCTVLGRQLLKERHLLAALEIAQEQRAANERRWRNELREVLPGELCAIVENGKSLGQSPPEIDRAVFRRILLPARSMEVRDITWAEVLMERGAALAELGDHDKAWELLREASAIFHVTPGADSHYVEASRTMAGICIVRSELSRAQEILERAAATPAATNDAIALALCDLAWALRLDGRFREALPVLRKGYELLAGSPKASELDQTTAAYRLAELERLLGGDRRAVVPHAVARWRASVRYFGAESHPAALSTRTDLALALASAGQTQDAERLYEQILPELRLRRWKMHPDTLQARSDYAALIMDRKDFPAAMAMFSDVLDDCRAGLGDRHIRTVAAWYMMGVVLSRQDRHGEAREFFQQAIHAAGDLRTDHPYQGTLLTGYGECLVTLGDFEVAERSLRRAMEIFPAQFDESHDRVQRAIRALTSLYAAWGNAEMEKHWRSRLKSAK